MTAASRTLPYAALVLRLILGVMFLAHGLTDRGMTPRLKSFLDFTLAKFGENPAKATWPKAASG